LALFYNLQNYCIPNGNKQSETTSVWCLTLAAKSKTLSGLGGSGVPLGPSESPRTMLTRQYSIRAMNTNLKGSDGQKDLKELRYILAFVAICNNIFISLTVHMQHYCTKNLMCSTEETVYVSAHIGHHQVLFYI
jgi:hypothetical protein